LPEQGEKGAYLNPREKGKEKFLLQKGKRRTCPKRKSGLYRAPAGPSRKKMEYHPQKFRGKKGKGGQRWAANKDNLVVCAVVPGGGVNWKTYSEGAPEKGPSSRRP